MKKKVGIITYHAAYNFGSALQAYATQSKIKQLGYNPKIINYRMNEQKKFYSMYRFKYGFKVFANDLLQLPLHNKRKNRIKKFENFFSNNYIMTKEFSNPEEVIEFNKEFDTLISGSDQIWNKHSCELHNVGWNYMNPYLLKNMEGKKISYASSIANMSDDELMIIKNELIKFKFISVRENSSVAKLSDLINKPVANVVDPTLLLQKEEWISLLELKKRGGREYILYYSLDGRSINKTRINDLKTYAKQKNCDLHIITPFIYIPQYGKNIKCCVDYGPIEFMEEIYNASSVVTDSYHGTILSVNLNKDVYSISGRSASDFRKTDFLKQVGLEERIINSTDELRNKCFKDIDYIKTNNIIQQLRSKSIGYIEDSLKDEHK